MNTSVKAILFTLLAICFTPTIQAQDKIQWYSMTEGLELAQKQNKKVFIDMYTSWCSWCKKMDAATFQKPDIASYINRTFIPVKFNAEQKTDIEYKGKVFKYVNYKQRGYHELAAELSKNLGRLSYPTIVFLDENLEVIQPIPGFQDPKSFEVIMHYIGDDHFKSKPFRAYQASFTGNYNK